jgi:phenolic acid decarboxylase
MACDIASSDQLQGLVGKRFVHIYDSSWRYELYVKNADTLDTLDYRIHSGMVGGRWSRTSASTQYGWGIAFTKSHGTSLPALP